MTTTPDLRSIFGGLADDVMPHLLGKPVNAATGLAALSCAHDADFDDSFLAMPLLPFQRAGALYATTARRALLGYQMGLGKTPIAIASIVSEKATPALVVCPPNLGLNWVEEFGKFAPQLNVARLTGEKPYDLPAADVYVIGDSIVSKWQQKLIGFGFRAMVVDESHREKDRTTARTKAVKAVARKVDRDGLVLCLSGTAVENSNLDILAQLDILGLVDSLFGDLMGFLNRYAPKVDAYKRGSDNCQELHDIIVDRCYARLLRNDVRYQFTTGNNVKLDRATPVIEMSGKALTDYKAAETDLRKYLRQLKSERQVTTAMRAEKLVRLGVLRRLAGQAKVAGTIEYVNNILDEDPTNKVLVFAWHRDVVQAYAEAFGAKTIMGGDKAEHIQAAKAEFQNGNARVLVLNIKAGGVGHNLQAANHVVFGEFAWTPGAMEQAEDRADRIGQQRDVLPHWTVAGNGRSTIDQRLIQILNSKAVVAAMVQDGKKVDGMVDEEAIAEALLASYEVD